MNRYLEKIAAKLPDYIKNNIRKKLSVHYLSDRSKNISSLHAAAARFGRSSSRLSGPDTVDGVVDRAEAVISRVRASRAN